MTKRIFTVLFALALLLVSGCSLAKPTDDTATTTPYADRLVGIFLTTEYINSFDVDAWLAENADRLVDGGTISIPKEEQTRIYATLVDGNYQFEGLDGFYLATYTMAGDPDNEETSYRTVDSSDYILDLHHGLHSTDNATTTELTGSLFVSNQVESVVFYCNPIYQTEDGKVYLVPGDGFQSAPGLATYTLSDTTTATENGTTQTYTATIEIKIDCVEIAQKIVLLEMDEMNREIGRTEWIPGQMPDEFTPSAETVYLIIEEHRTDGISRSIHQNGDDPIAVFYSEDGRLCRKEYLTVQWQSNDSTDTGIC